MTQPAYIVVSLDDVVLFCHSSPDNDTSFDKYTVHEMKDKKFLYNLSSKYYGSCSRQGIHSEIQDKYGNFIPRKVRIYFSDREISVKTLLTGDESYLNVVFEGVVSYDEWIKNKNEHKLHVNIEGSSSRFENVSVSFSYRDLHRFSPFIYEMASISIIL